METTINQRIGILANSKEKVDKLFAKRIGIRSNTLSNWTQGRKKWDDVDVLERIVLHYNISRDWLYGGEGAITRTAQAATEVNDEQAHYGYIPRKVYDDMLLKWNEDRESKKRLEEHIKFLESLINMVEKKKAC